MATIPGSTGSLKLVHFLCGVFLLHGEGGVALELLPSASEVLLQSNSNYTVECSGWRQVTWQLPGGSHLDGATVEDRGSSSTLRLINATWRSSGRYTCEEVQVDQRRHVDIFVPGRGPDEWFVPPASAVVMKEAEEDTVPCRVSDPSLTVSLYRRPGRTAVAAATYEPARGFTARLLDTSYVCVAERGAQERESQVFYVYSIVVPKVVEVELWASSSLLQRGDVLTINCTVRDVDMVYFSWDFPRRQEVEPLMEFLPGQIRSFVNITEATEADSGVYVCTVTETSQERAVMRNVSVTVLERGFVYAWPVGHTHVSALLHHTVEFRVEVHAYPPPTVQWMRNNRTLALETTPTKTTHLSGGRYVSSLTLVRVQMEQTGSYTATASNHDGVHDVIFHLEVKVLPKITSLSEVGSRSVLCISEGAPPPSLTWYTCHSPNRCTNLSDSWMNQSAASEGVALQENMTEEMEGGVTQVRSVLTLKSLSSVAAVRCEAQNSAGGRSRELRVLPTSVLSQVVVLAVVLVLVVLALVFLIILIFLWRKKPRCDVGWRLVERQSPDGRSHTYLDPAHLPYHPSWEIPRDHVVLGRLLAAGTFGRVVEATVGGLTPTESTTRAAVKMVKRRSDAVRSLALELRVMGHLGPHLNVVNLLGACTMAGPVCLIAEFCCHGDLVSYLQKNKHCFLQGNPSIKSDGDGGYMDMNKDGGGHDVTMKELSNAPGEDAAYEAPPTLSSDQQGATPLLLSSSAVLTLSDLLGFSFQICQAMDFLSSRKCVHRDLAARNVLVSEGKLVKVWDFGLARDLHKNQDYVVRGNSFVPLKWMSPESIFQNIYSSQSDVWSYGVLLWEIFSLGSSPYPNLPMNRKFCSALKTGHRMDPPEHAPSNMCDVMQQCWEEEPQSRPSFSSLVTSVGNMLSDGYRQRYLEMTADFLKGSSVVARSRWVSSRREEAQLNPQGSPTLEVKPHLPEAEPVLAGPSRDSFIIPVADCATGSGGCAALDAVSPQILECRDQPGTWEVASPEEEEESCL